MKKLFTLLTALMLCAISASAINVTVKVDNPEAVTISYYDATTSEKTTVQPTETDNTYNVKQISEFAIAANEGWYLAEIDNGANTYTMPGGGKNYSANIFFAASFTVTTVKEDEFKNATFTLKYDDAAQVKALLGGSEQIALDADAHEVTVSFSSEYQKTLTLSNPEGKKLYSVTVNDEPVAISGNTVTVDLTPNAVVDVVAVYPDVNVPVHFNFTNPDTSGFIKSLTVNGKDVEPAAFLADDFSVKLGSTLILVGDADAYEINETSVNGTTFSLNYFNDYKYTYEVSGETTFTIDVTAFPVIQKKIIVDGAEHFTFYNGYSWDGDVIELKDGENTVEFVEGEYGIIVSFEIDSDYYFEELSDNGLDHTEDYDYFELSPEGDLIITVNKIVKDKKFVMYIDDIDLTNNFSLQNENDQKYDVNSGYNTIEFYDGDGAEWYCNWATTDGSNQMFINDVEHDGYYGYSNQHYFEPQNDDVIRVYLGQTPEMIKVEFKVEDGLNLDVTRDLVTPVTDLVTPLTVFPNTQFNINSEGTPLKVKVGDQPEITSEMPEFLVTKPATITIQKDSSVGIESISADSTDKAVYNILGTKVASTANFDKLPKGIYILNGKKVSK